MSGTQKPTFWCAIKHCLAVVHCNPAGASGDEQNHNLATQVHSHMRAWMCTGKVETGTASIHFNAKQLHHQMTKTRDTRFCKWLRHLGAAFLPPAEEADNDIAEDFIEDEINNADSDVDEFNHPQRNWRCQYNFCGIRRGRRRSRDRSSSWHWPIRLLANRAIGN